MGEFKELFFNLILIGLVVISLFSFSSMFQTENAVDDKFIEDSRISTSFANLTTDLASARDKSQEQKDLFEADEGTVGFGSLLLKSILGIGKTFNSMVIGVWDSVIILPATVLGLDKIVISVLTTLLIITIVLGLWILYKLGG